MLAVPDYSNKIHFSRSALSTHLYVTYLSKFSPLKERLPTYIYRTKCGGLDIIWERKVVNALRKMVNQPIFEGVKEEPVPLSLFHLMVAFAILACGLMVAFILLLFEQTIFK